MQLSYFYNLAVPSQFAAPIQIFNTCRALCEHDATVTVYTNAITAASVAACLAFYGLAPHPNLQVVPLFAGVRSRRSLRRNLDTVLTTPPQSAPHIIMSRGEPGLDLFSLLPARRSLGQRYVYEAHKLCFVQAREEQPPGVRGFVRHSVLREVARVRAREQHAIAQADGLVCLTSGVRSAMQDAFHVTCPVLTLPSGTALPQHPPAADAAKDIEIIYVGKFERRKGVYDLITAMHLLPERRLWMVGGTDEQVTQLQRHAQQQGVAAQITFTGFVAPSDLAALYARARVGVCPLPAGTSTIADSFTSPLKVLEMMAHGVPIVATALPTLQAILDDQTALLVEPSNPAALAAAIERLLGDRRLALRLAQAARAQSATYSWAQRARRLHDFLATIGRSAFAKQ